jgi:hypothetical protein
MSRDILAFYVHGFDLQHSRLSSSIDRVEIYRLFLLLLQGDKFGSNRESGVVYTDISGVRVGEVKLEESIDVSGVLLGVRLKELVHSITIGVNKKDSLP